MAEYESDCTASSFNSLGQLSRTGVSGLNRSLDILFLNIPKLEADISSFCAVEIMHLGQAKKETFGNGVTGYNNSNVNSINT